MLEDFLENSPAGYFSFLDDGTLYTVNQTLCELLGYSKEDLQNKHVETIFTIPTRIFYQTHFFPLVKMQGHVEEIFISLLTKDRQYLPVLLNARRLEKPSPHTSCAFIVVPNRKQFEDELVNARNTAEKALKENSELLKARIELQQHSEELDRQIQTVNKQNNELQQLNHAVTHSLREPIRKLLVFTDKLQMEGLPDQIKPTIERLRIASENMKNIVSGLQQYLWLISSQNNFTKLDLRALISAIVARFLQDDDDVLQVTVGELPILEGDREQIELMIYHILSNAIKFRRSDKAIVTITGTVVKQNTFRATADKYKFEDFVRMEIRDEGVGFEPIYKESIFELFRKHHHPEGQGLGLALCKKVAENHSGVIEAYSKPGEFTVITILLPLAPERKD